MQIAGEPGPHILVALLCLGLLALHAAWPSHFQIDWITVGLVAILALALLIRPKSSR